MRGFTSGSNFHNKWATTCSTTACTVLVCGCNAESHRIIPVSVLHRSYKSGYVVFQTFFSLFFLSQHISASLGQWNKRTFSYPYTHWTSQTALCKHNHNFTLSQKITHVSTGSCLEETSQTSPHWCLMAKNGKSQGKLCHHKNIFLVYYR